MIHVYKSKYNNNNHLNRRKYYSKDGKITLNKRGYQNDIINKNINNNNLRYYNNNYINKDLLRYNEYYNINQNNIQQNCISNSNRKKFSYEKLKSQMDIIC